MTIYNIHIYREMRLVFEGIEAKSPEEAAEKARDLHFDDADDWSDCEGESLAALVDVVGDEEYSQSITIDFEVSQQLKAAHAMLATLKALAELRRKWRSQDEAETIDSIEYMDGLDSLDLDAVIAAATAARIAPSGNAKTPPVVTDDDASEPSRIEKQLTSSGMFHTPGFFRALQNDYRIKGEPRRRSIRMLSEGYGLPPHEAEGLLSGAIVIEMDEQAGTITYTVARATAAGIQSPQANTSEGA